jgi:glucose-1-phosphate cytidylyltransferase
MVKCVILAGGLGSRLSEETVNKPKPLVEIGGRPILWHIIQHYSRYGIREFIICLGYKGHLIKEYFFNYHLHHSDLTIDIKKNQISSSGSLPNWKIRLVDTGEDTLTGGRILRLKNILSKEKFFCLTYGDGLSDINIKKLIQHHQKEKKSATVTVVTPPGRFGSIQIKKNLVHSFEEKLDNQQSLINGGFFVLSPKIFKYISDDQTIWEQEPMKNLTSDGQLSAYYHRGFWQPMDTLRDKHQLEKLWQSGKAPWR